MCFAVEDGIDNASKEESLVVQKEGIMREARVAWVKHATCQYTRLVRYTSLVEFALFAMRTSSMSGTLFQNLSR
jgi:hypothetical protein